jgi:hypothetical protein
MVKTISADSKSTVLIFRTFSARDTIPLRMYGGKQCLESYMSLLNEYGMHYSIDHGLVPSQRRKTLTYVHES